MHRDELHELIDALPKDKIETAKDFLSYLVDREQSLQIKKVLQNAPEEDEPPTAEELKAIKEAEVDIKAGKVRSYNHFKRELGS